MFGFKFGFRFHGGIDFVLVYDFLGDLALGLESGVKVIGLDLVLCLGLG